MYVQKNMTCCRRTTEWFLFLSFLSMSLLFMATGNYFDTGMTFQDFKAWTFIIRSVVLGFVATFTTGMLVIFCYKR